MDIDATAVSNLLSLTLIIVTGVYVVLTAKIASDNRKMLIAVSEQHHETIRPYVVARIGIYEGVVFSLEIENTGKTRARNLRLNIDKDFHPFGDQPSIKTYDVFSKKIESFSPNERLVILLSQGFNMDNVKDGKNLTPEEFIVTASYEDGKNSYTEKFEINTTAYNNTIGIRKTPEHLKFIGEQIKKISDRMK